MRMTGTRVSLLALAIAAVAGGAQAGQEIYIALVGNDILAHPFYLSEKHRQFLHPNSDRLAYCAPAFPGDPRPAGAGHVSYTNIDCEAITGVAGSRPVEYFKINNVYWDQFAPGNWQPEVCDADGTDPDSFGSDAPTYRGNPNGLISSPPGDQTFEWRVVLPKKPVSNINLVFQCGVLKQQALAVRGFPEAIWTCAGETAERVGGNCTRAPIAAGSNPVLPTAQPRLTAILTGGEYGPTPGASFNLTAYRVPGPFTLGPQGVTALTGGQDDRVHLKACLSESVIVKLPVRTYDNDGSLGPLAPEFDVTQGDHVTATLTFPSNNTMHVFCNWESLKVEGMGEPETLLP